MSKNFEEEYRRMIDLEVPDLWDRIEAQLPAADSVSANDNTLTAESNTLTVSDSASTNDNTLPASDSVSGRVPAEEAAPSKAPSKLLRFRRKTAGWVIFAAAALCLLLVLPTFLRQAANSSDFAARPQGEPSNSIQSATNGAPSHRYEADSYEQAESARPIKNEAPASDNAPFSENANGMTASDVPSNGQSPMTAAEFLILKEIQSGDGTIWYEAVSPEGDLCLTVTFTGGPQDSPDHVLTPGQTYLLDLYPTGAAAEDPALDDDFQGTFLYVILDAEEKN